MPSVPAVWREAERPLVKGKSDKWARKGATTRVWLRPATADDVESKAVSTAGARTHGLLGENIRRKEAQAKREARMLRAQGHGTAFPRQHWKRRNGANESFAHSNGTGACELVDAACYGNGQGLH